MACNLCSFYQDPLRSLLLCLVSYKLKFTGQLQMASLSLYPQFETNLMSNRKVIELLLQLQSAKAHGKKLHKSQTTPGPPSFA